MNNKVITYINTNKKKISICAAFTLFVFTMLYNLTHSTLGGDEWVEYYYSQVPIKTGELYEKIVSTFQPPLYNFIMHFWLKLGKSIFWFRLFNVFIGLGSGIFLFMTIKRLYSDKVAVWSLSALAVCYRWVYCTQECSEYAIMLFFIFAAIFFFVESGHKFTYVKALLFILASVGAIYSQYGSVFVIVPLLICFYVNNVFEKDAGKKKRIIITISYLLSLLIFAVPLYVFFAKEQMAHNKIASNTVAMSIGLFKDFPFVLGRIIGFFYSQYTEGKDFIWCVISVSLIILCVNFIIKGNKDKTKKSLVISLCIAYVLHYILVKMHIYAMVHADQSIGFYCRYSYFYIPLLMVAIPILIVELYRSKNEFFIRLCPYLCGASFVCMYLSFSYVLDNWEKTKVDEMAQIYMEQEGWNYTTYFIGPTRYGFKYYVQYPDDYEEETAATAVNVDDLPIQFWVCYTSWGYDRYYDVLEKAEELGYEITVYMDEELKGALAFCSYLGEYEELDFEKDEVNISNCEINENGEVELKLSIDTQGETPVYNNEGYKITYHIVDLEYNKLRYYNRKVKIGSWVSKDGYVITFNPELLEGTKDYIIQIDIIDATETYYLSNKGFTMPEIKIIDNKVVQ